MYRHFSDNADVPTCVVCDGEASQFTDLEFAECLEDLARKGKALIANPAPAEKLSDKQWSIAMDFALRDIYQTAFNENPTIERHCDLPLARYGDALTALAATSRDRPAIAFARLFIVFMAKHSLAFFQEIARSASHDVTTYLLRRMARSGPKFAVGFYSDPSAYLSASPSVEADAHFTDELNAIVDRARVKAAV